MVLMYLHHLKYGPEKDGRLLVPLIGQAGDGRNSQHYNDVEYQLVPFMRRGDGLLRVSGSP